MEESKTNFESSNPGDRKKIADDVDQNLSLLLEQAENEMKADEQKLKALKDQLLLIDTLTKDQNTKLQDSDSIQNLRESLRNRKGNADVKEVGRINNLESDIVVLITGGKLTEANTVGGLKNIILKEISRTGTVLEAPPPRMADEPIPDSLDKSFIDTQEVAINTEKELVKQLVNLLETINVFVNIKKLVKPEDPVAVLRLKIHETANSLSEEHETMRTIDLLTDERLISSEKTVSELKGAILTKMDQINAELDKAP